MIKRISTVLCPVADMGRAVEFYRDLLGLTPTMVSQWWTAFPLGDTQIGLHPPFTDAPKGSGWIVGVEVDDIRELRSRLETTGTACAPYHDTPTGVVMDFADPDGNAIQAMQVGVKAKDLA